jgi:hypothetical protein
VWEGFKLLDGGIASVKGLTVHILKGNSTKSSIKDQTRFNIYESFYQAIIGKEKPNKVVYAVNKDNSTFTAPNPNDVLAKRGTDTRGSNDFLDGDCMIVVMALFTTCEDYALRAALCTGEPIPCDAIWKRTTYGIVPRMDKCGFVDTRLQLAFMRQAVDECYQAIMRIGVRRYDRKAYHVVCRLPDTLCVAELEGRLPDVQVEKKGFDTVKSWNHSAVEKKIYENAGKIAIASLSPTAARLAHVRESCAVS